MKFLSLFLCLLAACSPGCASMPMSASHQRAEDATFQMFVFDGQDNLVSRGTAWVIAPHYIMTAGHMCAHPPSTRYILRTSKGRAVSGEPVEWEMSMDPSGDLCLLKSDSALPAGLSLAPEMPEEGEAIGYNGWPLGVYTQANGLYDGDGKSSAPCDHGSSGSAMFDSEGVWGVLVQLRDDDKPGCVATQLPEIKRFLHEALHDEPDNEPLESHP